jgi:hypothetical protein
MTQLHHRTWGFLIRTKLLRLRTTEYVRSILRTYEYVVGLFQQRKGFCEKVLCQETRPFNGQGRGALAEKGFFKKMVVSHTTPRTLAGARSWALSTMTSRAILATCGHAGVPGRRAANSPQHRRLGLYRYSACTKRRKALEQWIFCSVV